MKEMFGKMNVSENLSSEDVQASVDMTISPSSRSFSECPDLSSFIGRKFQPRVRKRLLNQRELRSSLPSICITPSASDAEHSPIVSRKLGTSLGNVENGEGNESRNFSIHPGDQKYETEEQEKEKGTHQPYGIEKEENVMYQERVGVEASTLQAGLTGLPAMGMQLRDKTRVFEGVMNTEVQNGASSRK